jgi:hypothetical protein
VEGAAVDTCFRDGVDYRHDIYHAFPGVQFENTEASLHSPCFGMGLSVFPLSSCFGVTGMSTLIRPWTVEHRGFPKIVREFASQNFRAPLIHLNPTLSFRGLTLRCWLVSDK